MSGYEEGERRRALRMILRSLNIEWRNGGECINTCRSIEKLFDIYATKDKTQKDFILTQLADIIEAGVDNKLIKPSSSE